MNIYTCKNDNNITVKKNEYIYYIKWFKDLSISNIIERNCIIDFVQNGSKSGKTGF